MRKYFYLINDRQFGPVTKEELKNKTELEKKFNREIDELNQETENLVDEIEKWPM